MMVAKNKRQTKSMAPMHFRLKEGIFILAIALSLFLLLALISYHKSDPGWSRSGGAGHVIANAGGRAGAWFADVFLYLFGYMAYCFPLMICYSAYLLFRERSKQTSENQDKRLISLRGVGYFLVLISGCALLSLHQFSVDSFLPYRGGGILGNGLGEMLVPLFNFLGATIFLFALFLAGVTLITGLSWFKVMEKTGQLTISLGLKTGEWIRNYYYLIWEYWDNKKQAPKKEKVKKLKKVEPKIHHAEVIPPIASPKIEPTIAVVTPSKRAIKERQGDLFGAPKSTELPELNLLDQPSPGQKRAGFSASILQKMSGEVEEHLRDFNIEAQVVAVHPGPVITRFELQLAPGVKVSKITGLAKDLARSLSVISVRVVEVIPGKSVIGLELPNENREVVRLSEVLASEQYEKAKSPLTIGLGKDISGLPVSVDLSKMPHLLVAGTTGSGKSVCVNAMLMSLLYKATPEQVRMIMIDPKMLELSVYEGIPHLLTPVVTDMKEAANALRWCVSEMERRYRLMAALGVRNLAGFNIKVSEAIKKNKPIPDPLWVAEDVEESAPDLKTLPFIVVVVDEFADMMMVVGKKVEQLIARIAQKARAAGIHMILATQRPSVDVITGLIKANVPTRIAFQVSSKVDSRTIIDQQGAEQLLGNGDMLYLPPGKGVPVRIHGAFVADHEVHNVVKDLQKHGDPEYLDDVLAISYETDIHASMTGDDKEGESDPLYDQAVQIVIETQRASISSVQRRLKIGYNRAARLVEDMEKAGIVSPMESNGSREVLMPNRE